MTSSTFTASNGNACEIQIGRWSRRFVDKFLRFVDNDAARTVLDLECGTGALMDALARVSIGMGFPRRPAPQVLVIY